LIDPEDSTGFATVLMHVLAHPELRAEMGRAAVNRARKTFDWKVIAEEWVALLDDVSAPRSKEINLDGSGERVVS
jgi:glycosyltransferase involved in cell wall biosynthesis